MRLYVCLNETMMICTNKTFRIIPKGAICALVGTKKISLDNKEWLKIKYLGATCEGHMNPKDFIEVKK